MADTPCSWRAGLHQTPQAGIQTEAPTVKFKQRLILLFLNKLFFSCFLFHGSNSHSPMTLLAKEALLSVASPRSPILTEPVGPVMKMLSHLRSRWMMGGVRVCRKWSPLRIWRLHRCSSFSFISLNLFKYLKHTHTQKKEDKTHLLFWQF